MEKAKTIYEKWNESEVHVYTEEEIKKLNEEKMNSNTESDKKV